MAITLHGMSGSPFTWKVQLALEHKRLSYEMRWLSPSKGDLRTPEFAQLNPRRLAPVLTDCEITVYESDAIVRYLEAAYPEPTLFPGNLAAQALAFRLIAEVESHLAPSVEDLVLEILFKPDPTQRNAEKIEKARRKLQAELQHFERELRGDFLAGALSAADFVLYPSIMLGLRIEKRQPELELSAALGEKLVAWMKRIEALPYYDRTYPPHWRAG
jgi:glutathione S-transferase